jgi:hypothetical protein
MVLDVALRVRGRYVSGQGELRDPLGKTIYLNVSGEYSSSAIRLDMASRDRIVARFVGRLEANDTMRGVLLDSGVASDSLFFFRLEKD